MKGKKTNKILRASLAASLLLSVGIPYNVKAESPLVVKSSADVEKVLLNLSKEQRKALKQLDVGTYPTISPDIDTTSSELVDIIVEFKHSPAKIEVMKQAVKGRSITLASASSKIEEEHQAFKQYVETLQLPGTIDFYDAKQVEIKREYKNAINGVSMTVPAFAIKDLVKSEVVKRVYKDYEVKVELPKEPEGGIQPKMADSIPQIGVDKLHAENITGKGIKVGVLDTGIDYNHPDLLDSYKGYRAQDGVDPAGVDPKSVIGWDFINDDADPMETTYQDWKNSGKPEFNSIGSYYTSHGTHVSGTIAAQKKNNVDYAIKGVAPDVDLYSYKVLGPYGSGSFGGVIAGIDKAIEDGMDVINLSLGDSVNDALSAASVAVNNAMLSGVVTVVSSGNSGPDQQTLGSPGTAAFSISVGASDVSINIPEFNGQASNETFTSVQLLAKDFSDNLEELQGKSFPVVFAGIGKKTDFEGKDFNGKIALIERGELSFDEKIKNAKEAGAQIVIVYNNVDGAIPSYVGEGVGYVPAFRLSKADGERLKELGETSFAFDKLSNTKTEGDHLADFSSRGPVLGNNDIKPDVVAPGVAILSTMPEFINNPQDGIDYSYAYSHMQGTSMAAPHVAGTAALILQEHPEYSPFDVKVALMNTADDLNGEYSVNEVGSGRIDAYEAVHADTFIKVLDKTQNIENDEIVEIDEITGSIGFGKIFKQDDSSNKVSKKISVQNDSKDEKTFGMNIEYHGARNGVKDPVQNGLQVSVAESVTVASGQTQELQVEIEIPASAEIGRYEGYIHVANTNDIAETYQLPFSVMVTEKGFASMSLSRPSVTNDTLMWEYFDPTIHGLIQLNNPLSSIDVIMKDNKTQKPIAFIGTIDGSSLVPDNEYLLFMLFAGLAYPFTNDPSKPIGDMPIKLPAGDYSIEMIGYDEQGKSYSIESPMIVDNVGPKIEMEKNGVIEVNDSMFTVEDGVNAFWIHGTVKDDTVDLLRAKGLDFDQSSNILPYYENDNAYIRGFFPVQPNGDVKIGIEKSDYAKKPFRLGLLSSDIATAVDTQTLFIMQEGTEYTNISYDKKELKLKDSVTMTLSLNNVNKLVSGKFDVNFNKRLYKFNNVKLNSAIKKYAKEKGLDVTLDKESIIEGTSNNTLKVGASINGKAFSGLNGDMPFLDVKFTLVDDKYYLESDAFFVKNGSYLKAGQSVATPIADYSTTGFEIISTHSTVQGYIGPDAFLTNSGYLISKDYTKIGAKAYAISRSGKKYNGTIDNRGRYLIADIPASNQEYTIVIEVPGHFKSMMNFIPGYSVDGQLRGQNLSFPAVESLAGDINGDKMIDIKDIQLVVDAYGMKDTSIVKEDINQDGVVDETDVRYVEKNFLSKGPDASASAQPKESIGKKGIEYFLRLIGLELNN